MTPAQWYWYLYNIVQDQDEEFETKRNLIEYHASFLEPEMVDKARKRRKEKEESAKKDDNFVNTIKGMFGRDIKFKDQPTKESNFSNMHEVSNILDKIDEYDRSQKRIKSRSTYNFVDWVNFDME